MCGALTALMTGVTYATSAEMARELGPFAGYERNAEPHAARDPQPPRRRPGTGIYEGLNVNPVILDAANCPDQALITLARGAWDEALELGRRTAFAMRRPR